MTRVLTCMLAAALLASGELIAQSTPDGSLGRQSAFGRALSISGTDVLIGEPDHETKPGQVFVYRKAAGKWAETTALSARDGAVSDGFGTSMATAGNLAVIGSLRANENRGAAYVFQRDARGAWTQIAKLTASDGATAENFATAVAIAGDLALVGASSQNKQTGAVYVYRRSGNNWTQEAKLLSPEAKEQGFFGTAVAVMGDRILVGEPGYNERTGTVHVFAREGTAWKAVSKLSTTGVQKNERFGMPIVMEGNRVYVGVVGFGSNSGAVYAFARDAQGELREVGRHFAFEARANEQFGNAIAASGNNLWIGAPRASGGRGMVYHIWRDAADSLSGASNRMLAATQSRNDFFGFNIAAGSNLVAIAALNDDFGLGSVTIYEFANGKWTPAPPLGRPDERMASITGKKVECNNSKAGAFGCANVELMSFVSIADMGGSRGVQVSGIWGWTDPQSNREYALVGRFDGTSFVDVTDPSNPRYIGDLPLTPGSNAAPWREIKTYKNYALISADGAGPAHLQIFDLTQLRNVKTPQKFQPTVLYKRVNSVHNIVVNEESGFAYAVGSSSGGETCGGGLHMIDIRDPLNPQFAGCFADPQTGRASTGYSHDALCVNYRGPDQDYANREICLGSNETMLSIADVTDKKNPKALSRAAYPKVGYLHQGWFTKDMRYFYMNDELDEVSGLVQNTRTLVWDLADLDDPQMILEFSSPTQASDHNLYIKDDLMYQSHYKAGVRLVDVSNPTKPVEIGFFDTAPTQPDTPGFAGSWGNFPYFKSGTWIASSMNEGLFVLKKKDTTKPVL
jgi:choice-of-anchor B domain-containing protein